MSLMTKSLDDKDRGNLYNIMCDASGYRCVLIMLWTELCTPQPPNLYVEALSPANVTVVGNSALKEVIKVGS